MLCYVNHHDHAYDWAERRKLETHPKTGAAQIVEIRETVKEVVVPIYVHKERPVQPKPKLFTNKTDDELLTFGVPAEWLNDVRQVDEDSLLILSERLPAEAAEALLELATGGKPRITQPAAPISSPFDHPDAQRRFRVMSNVEELQRALDYPWEKWTVFLHPEQRQFVEKDYSGPARVSGSAGTGKTIVALHRAVFLTRSNPDARVLLATFSDTLAHALHTKLRRLIGNEPRLAERIDVCALDKCALRLYKAQNKQVKVAESGFVRELVNAASTAVGGHKFSHHFLITEWEQVVNAWQLQSWEEYRDVARLGRRTRLSEAPRKVLWAIFEKVQAGLKSQGQMTLATVFTELAKAVAGKTNPAYDYTVIDEAQDISISQLRFLAALGGGRTNALFFAGDLGQRIFQQPFSWKALGVEVRGRARTLRINYRTSHQIRQQADRLLGPEIVDIDGNEENRSDTVSIFNGPQPVLQHFADKDKEAVAVGAWIKEQAGTGLKPHEFGVFVRSAHEIDRAKAAVEKAGLPYKVLDESVETTTGHVSICTMHMAKGLEFRAVVVMACDDEVIPLKERIEAVGDDADLKEIYDTERHLLYVACTRARDHLLVTCVEPGSEFLDDLKWS